MASWHDVRAIGLAFPEAEEAPSYDGTPALDDLAAYLEWSYRLRAPKRLAALLDAGPAGDGPSPQEEAPTRAM